MGGDSRCPPSCYQSHSDSLASRSIPWSSLSAATIVCRESVPTAMRHLALLLLGVGFGIAASLGAGGLAVTADRISVGVHQADPGSSTRLELWKGTVSTIAASPITGFGPDG